MQETYLNRAALNIVLLDRLSKLLSGIPAPLKIILLKGAALLHTVYAQDLGARHLGDADLLVRKEALPVFRAFLSDEGYCFSGSSPEAVETNSLNSVVCTKKESLWPSLHVHWHLVNSAYPNTMYASHLDMARIWEAARPLPGFRGVFLLAPHHQLIHLCEHALKHSYAHTHLLQDVDRLLGYHGDEFPWDELISETKLFHLDRPVYYGLYLARRLRGTKIPSGVLEALKPGRSGFLEKRFCRAVLGGRVSESHLCDAVYLAMHEGMGAKLRFMQGVLFPPALGIRSCLRSLSGGRLALHHMERSMRGFLQCLRAARCLMG